LPDHVYIILLLIAPTLLVWRWNWVGVWLGALTLWLEIVILMVINQPNLSQMDLDNYRDIAASGLLALLYCLFVMGCKSWYTTLRSDR
jgi:hypothetical protein